MADTYRIERGSIQHKFAESRAKIQFFGGGFANGKTTALVVKALRVIQDYPGCNILIARATRPKLNDTVRKVFFKWCPRAWVKSFNKTDNTAIIQVDKDSAECTVNFRYISQQGKAEESTTSNLLSATYDAIFVDQIEDPEITYKDFLDLLGRLRGVALYRGDDPTMPRSGPRWLILTSNPTRNWVYRKLIMPLHLWKKKKIRHPDLIVDGATGQPMIELFEGSTYTNAANLPADYISSLESAYTGQMKKRYVDGEWAGFEGLIYPMYDEAYHLVRREEVLAYIESLLEDGIQPTFIEGYDHGMAQPGCYILAVVDHRQNIIIVDGRYAAEKSPEWWAKEIKDVRAFFGVNPKQRINADPAIFRRSPGGAKVVGKTVAAMFEDEGIHMQRGDNSINAGLAKVQQYLAIQESKLHPFKGQFGAPCLYVIEELSFWTDEITDYYWDRNKHDQHDDKPRDKNDHAMDATKYMLSREPTLAFVPDEDSSIPAWMLWHEQVGQDDSANTKRARHGRH